jgi:hypothetical protein
MTMNELPTPWGNILKSNSNGTYFGVSIENVNRNNGGFVDFEKFAGLNGVAMVNVVANPAEATLTGRKILQTRITHNDGMLCVLITFSRLIDSCCIRWHLEGASSPFSGLAGSEVSLFISGMS